MAWEKSPTLNTPQLTSRPTIPLITNSTQPRCHGNRICTPRCGRLRPALIYRMSRRRLAPFLLLGDAVDTLPIALTAALVIERGDTGDFAEGLREVFRVVVTHQPANVAES
jgi:hypothetical protein